MGRVWLCTGRIAENPLFLETEGVSLYTFEELCYYLYQNAELVGESFFNERLCQWLETEIEEKELSQNIRAGIDREESGCWCLEQILEAGGFYSQGELQKVLQAVAWMERKGPLERAKLRGDRLLRDGNCREAVLAYRKALQMEGQEGASLEGERQEGEAQKVRQMADAQVIGRIWHNMGTAYAYNMLFSQAAYCYGKAYEIGEEEVSKRDYLRALACREGKVPEGGSDSLAKAKKELSEKKKSGDWAGYEKMMEHVLENLRTEYRESE